MTLEQNLARAEGYLQQFKAKPILHRIGGKDVAASDGQTFESLSPVDLSVDPVMSGWPLPSTASRVRHVLYGLRGHLTDGVCLACAT